MCPGTFSSSAYSPVLNTIFRTTGKHCTRNSVPIPSSARRIRVYASSKRLTAGCYFRAIVRSNGINCTHPACHRCFPGKSISLKLYSIRKSKDPSLNSFLRLNDAHVGSSQILPVIPILPGNTTLINPSPCRYSAGLGPHCEGTRRLTRDINKASIRPIRTRSLPSRINTPARGDSVPLPTPHPLPVIPVTPLRL